VKRAILLFASVLFLVACDREERNFRSSPGQAQPAQGIAMSSLRPGATGNPPLPASNLYEDSAYSVSQGKKLYNAFNCGGCHSPGGGGNIGPALIDSDWLYGSEPANVYATIVEGRPNGMPSFRGKIPEAQVWQIVAYVRSMSGQVPTDISPNRSDHMNLKEAENRTKNQPEKQPPEKQK
jgi:cytochrome c oxidase cbb3-type subunit 3